MQETVRPSSTLARWFARQKRDSDRLPSLHNLVFGTDMLRYLSYRTRYVMAIALLRVGLHIAEFALLAYMLPMVMYNAMVVRLLSLMIEGGWWGMTDAMRHRIRQLRRQRDLAGIQREILGWLTLAIILAVFIIAGAVALCFWWFPTTSWPFMALIMAMSIQTSLRIISRTFYSGAYAIRRVFLPVEMMIGPEILVFVAGIAFWPLLGEWNVALCIMLSSLVVAAVSYRYVRHVTDFLRITPRRFFSPRMISYVFRHHHWPKLAQPAFAALGMRLHDVLLVLALRHAAIEYVALRSVFPQQLLFTLYLVMPLLRSCMNWSQVMYFDLSKYHLDMFARFRTTLERVGLGYSLLLSMIFSFLVLLVIEMFASSLLGITFRVVLPYLMVSAVLGFVLVSLFARRRYYTVMCLCALQYSLLWVMVAMNAGVFPIPDGLMMSLLLPLGIGLWQLRRSWQPPEEALNPYLPWVAALCRRPGATLVLRMNFHPSVKRGLPAEVARDIAFAMGNRLALSINGRTLLVAADGQENKEILIQELLRFCRGFVIGVDMVTDVRGVNAYSKAISSGLLIPAPEVSTPSGLLEEFRRRFPAGLVLHPMRSNSALLAATSSTERRDILYDARRAGEGDRRKQSERWFISSLFTDPYLSLVFLVPKTEPNAGPHAAWLRFLADLNLQALEQKHLKPADSRLI